MLQCILLVITTARRGQEFSLGFGERPAPADMAKSTSTVFFHGINPAHVKSCLCSKCRWLAKRHHGTDTPARHPAECLICRDEPLPRWWFLWACSLCPIVPSPAALDNKEIAQVLRAGELMDVGAAALIPLKFGRWKEC
jgi:hypothetical protein